MILSFIVNISDSWRVTPSYKINFLIEIKFYYLKQSFFPEISNNSKFYLLNSHFLCIISK